MTSTFKKLRKAFKSLEKHDIESLGVGELATVLSYYELHVISIRELMQRHNVSIDDRLKATNSPKVIKDPEDSQVTMD